MRTIYIFGLLCILTFSQVFSGPFTPGNIVVVRIGDGSVALSSAGASVFLDEFTPAGVLVQSIQMPVTLSGANKRLVTTGNSTSEGNITLSADKRFVTLCGYDTIPGFAAVATTAGISRVIGTVDYSGVINTTTTITDGFTGSNIRGSYTNDGTAYWTSGTGTGGGVRYVVLGASTSTQVSTSVTNTRFIYIYNGQLYVSSASGAFLGVNKVGTGTPTGTGEIITNFVNTGAGSSSYGFAFNPAGTVCYIADDRATASGGGIQKWTFDGSVWTLAYTLFTNLTTGARGMTADFSGANPVIYVSNNVNVAVTTDAGSSSVFTLLSTAATNTVYRGISFVPVQPLPPPPAAPNLLSPANNSTGNLTALNLVWNKPAGPVSTYRVQLSSDSLFNTLLLNDSTITDSVRSVSGLTPLTNYWWRVRGKNAGGSGTFSTAFKFKTLGVPTTVNGPFIPANGSTNQPTTINFKWARAFDQTLKKSNLLIRDNSDAISNYWFELTTDSIAQPIVVRDSTLTDTLRTATGLLNSTSYYWRVKAKNQIGWGSFSFWQKLVTVAAVPPAPNLTLPANNALTLLTLQLVWDSIPSASTYRVQISTDSTFATTLKDTSGVLTSRYNVYAGLLTTWNVWYYWRVQATNAGGTGPFSLKFRFMPFLDGVNQQPVIPVKFALYDNYPNPFNPVTKIKFDLPKAGNTILTVYDVLGRETQKLVNEFKPAGRYEIDFDGTNYSSGIYFYKIESGNFTDIKKMILVK